MDATPETVQSRVFALINESRETYHFSSLQLDEDLTVIAGEHACNMSTERVSFGHTGFGERMGRIPLAISYSENVASLPPGSMDPAIDIVRIWLSRSLCLSRIFASFTHTGIGIAESGEGGWYVSQIFATFRSVYSKKDLILLVLRAANLCRKKESMTDFVLSLAASGHLANHFKSHGSPPAENVFARTMFLNCSHCTFFTKTVRTTKAQLSKFFISFRSGADFTHVIRNDSLQQIAIAAFQPNPESVTFVVYFGAGVPGYGDVPRLHVHFRPAFHFLVLLNAFRQVHGRPPLTLSHQFCRAAKKQVGKMMDCGINSPDQLADFAQRVSKHLPGAEIKPVTIVLPTSADPLPEILLCWSSQPRAKRDLLADYPFFGFATSVSALGVC
jgi:uncharacterized protein YkwD